MIKKFLDYFIKENVNDDIPDFDDEPEVKLTPIVEIFDEDSDFDKIILSKKLENRLKELKIGEGNPKINVGDDVFLVNEKQSKLSDEVFKFLKSRDIFKVLRINDKGKLDIGCYQRYRRESDNKKIKKVFYFSARRFQKVDTLDPVAQFILSLKHISKEDINQNPVDFLDVNNKGVLSCLSRRFANDGDPFKSPRRQELKFNKLLLRIVTKDYYEKHLKQKHVEVFMNKWRMLFDNTYTVVVLEGKDILDAYDHKTISNGWKHSSCANFTTRSSIGHRYDVYTDNVENIKCLAVYHKGKIHGRRMLFTGVQTNTHGKFKAGETYTVLNSMYGEGGRDAKADAAMQRWAKDNGADLVQNLRGSRDIFRIKIQRTCYKQYPPWDYMFVNFKLDEIASTTPDKLTGWQGAYGARCNLKK